MKQRILFVDDEPKVLAGLGRLLYSQRQEWAMQFASGGQDALAKLAVAPFDVIVTDMRMPDMDGGQLLAEVREHYPHIARIVLSGQCDKDAFMRLARVAHRHLPKPCEPAALKETVTRVCRMRTLLANDKLIALLSHLESVPSQPSVYLAAVRELEMAEPSVTKVAALVIQDLGMTAKVVQLANSVTFGAPRPISSVEQAVLVLGSDVLKALVLAMPVFSELAPVNLDALCPDDVRRHCLATSTLARRIATEERCGTDVIDCACVAGMLHDIGILILAYHWTDGWQQVLQLAHGESIPLVDAEHAILGATHAEIGAYLLGLWGLDPAIVDAVAMHHRPGDCSATEFTPLTAVHVADALTLERTRFPSGYPGGKIDEKYLGGIGLLGRLPVWHALANGSVREENLGGKKLGSNELKWEAKHEPNSFVPG